MASKPVSTNGGGNTTTTGPINVCFTVPPPPPKGAPAPMMSIGMLTALDSGRCSKKVIICSKKTAQKGCKVKSTKGDEPGINKGVKAPNRGDVAVQTTGHSDKVRAEGKPVVVHGSKWKSNGSNANAPMATHVTPSQTKVFA
jgi:hypothetical protein